MEEQDGKEEIKELHQFLHFFTKKIEIYKNIEGKKIQDSDVF